VILLGGVFGWVLSSVGDFYLKSFYFDFFFFVYFSVFMCFFVFFFSQFFLFRFFRLGFYFLYVMDRGWNEVFGGQGIFRLLKSSSSYVVSFQSSFITSYLGVGVVFLIFTFFVFIFVFGVYNTLNFRFS